MKCLLRAAILVSALACVCSFETAQGQAIVIGLPTPQITLYAPAGGFSPPDTIPISISMGSATFTAAASTQIGVGWLQVTPLFGQLTTTPASLTVTANATNLSPGTYAGFIDINVAGLPTSVISITLNVGVAGVTTIYATPDPIVFAAQENAAAPPAQALNVYATALPMGFTATVNSTGNWLQLTPAGGNTPAVLSVLANTQGLTVGVYNGVITLTPEVGTALNIPVTLTVGTGAAMNAFPASLKFFYQVGQLTPPIQLVTFSSSSGSRLAFGVTASDSWISLTPTIANTTQDVVVSVDPRGFAPGTYTSSIIASSPGATNPLQAVPVTLVVSTGNLLALGTPPADFNFQVGGALPAPQAVTLGSTSTALNYTLNTTVSSGGNWLTVTGSNAATPSTLTVSVNPSGLAPGVYTAQVTVTAPDAVNSPQSFTVRLNVTTVPTLNATPGALLFSYETGAPNQLLSQPVTVTGSGNPEVTVTTATSNCGSGWLQVSSDDLQTPAQLTVTVAPAGIAAPQLCHGTVTLTAAGIATVVEIPVTLNVSTSGLLVIAPGALSFTATFNNGVPPTQKLTLTTTDNSQIQYSAYSTASWLAVTPGPGWAPTPLLVTVNPIGLTPGFYTAGIVISSPGLPAQETIPVVLTVNGVSNVTLSATALVFSQTTASGAPPPQSFTISSGAASLAFTATAAVVQPPTTWLSVSPNSGTTPATLTVSINPGGLQPGIYPGAIVVNVPGAAVSTMTVSVTLTVTPAVGIGANVNSLQYNYQVGGTNPPSQFVALTATGGLVPFTAVATTASGGNWLSLVSTAASAPATLTVSVNPAGLGPGNYSGQVSIAAPGAIGSPIFIIVTLQVVASNVPNPTSVLNAASLVSGRVAAGEIVTIKGTSFGPPAAGVLWQANFNRIDTLLAGTRVWFDNFPAPILYTSATQINVIAPYEIAGQTTTQLSVEYQGTRSQALTLPVAPAVPGIFTQSSTGSGQGSILNEDGTVNSASNAAAKGSVIQIFATAGGQTNPPGVTGGVTGAVQAPSVYNVTATVGGQPATVKYAGAAPNSVTGLFQVNVLIPDNPGSNPAAQVVISVDNQTSPATATVAIQ
jgi:uncharacterized protein (TIGR03437 family)